MSLPPPYPTIPQSRPAPAAFGSGYRVWAWVLICVPSVVIVVMGGLSLVMLVYAQSDPSSNSAAGYLALLVLFLLAVGSPVLIGMLIPGIVMLTRSNRARVITRSQPS